MNVLTKRSIGKKSIIVAIIIFFIIAILSKMVNELGVNFLANQQERKNGIIVGAEPFFIQKDKEIGVLLIHGFTSSPKDFSEFAEFLSNKNITVYVPLLPGHGTHPRDLREIKYEDWINAVQQALNLLDTEKKFVLGYSMGGTLALYLATQNDFNGVISINSAIFLESRYIPFVPLVKLVETYTAKNAEAIIELIDEDRIVYDSTPLDSITELQKLINEVNLSEITEPILIFQADNDKTVSPESASHIYINVKSNEKEIIILSNSTHSRINDKEDALEKVYEFILAHQ